MAALESVMFGNGVEEIGDYAFENCTSLSKVYIPVSVKKIGAEAFLVILSAQNLHLIKTSQ